MSLLFLLPVATQARFYKRITGVRAEGEETTALYFDRDYVPGKTLPGASESLGPLDHGNYGGRLRVYTRAWSRIRSLARKHEVLYCFGMDLALLGWLASIGLSNRPRLVYEAGDIREAVTGTGIVSKILRTLDRFLCRRCRLIVVTSPAYVSEYYHRRLGLQDVEFHLVENKLPKDFCPDSASPATASFSGRIRIGYFGILRCERSWQVLRRVLELAPERFEIRLSGKIWPDRIDEAEVRSTAGVEYGGPYVAPDDLPELYRDIDLVWAAHHHGDNNLKWARANRFYEACFFGRPMAGQLGTVDGNAIDEMGLGCLVDLKDIEASAQRIVEITPDDLASWQAQVEQVPEELYRYTQEHAELLRRLDPAESGS